MSNLNASRYDSKFSFPIEGVSYIGMPIKHTAMYVTKKIENQLINLEKTENCVVFVEKGTNVPAGIKEHHLIIEAENPKQLYVSLAREIECCRRQQEKFIRYEYKNGSYISESAIIGKNAYIEPFCKIGHRVTIGNNAVLMSGTVINDAEIGDDFISNEHAVIGANGFTMYDDENDKISRIPSLGGVIIGNGVEIGAHDNISRGSAGNTIIDDNVKLDALVYIGHDAHLYKGVCVASGVIIGGFAEIKENVYLGVNSTIRNRICVRENALVGMGAVVTKEVNSRLTVVGNPAKPLDRGHCL